MPLFDIFTQIGSIMPAPLADPCTSSDTAARGDVGMSRVPIADDLYKFFTSNLRGHFGIGGYNTAKISSFELFLQLLGQLCAQIGCEPKDFLSGMHGCALIETLRTSNQLHDEKKKVDQPLFCLSLLFVYALSSGCFSLFVSIALCL